MQATLSLVLHSTKKIIIYIYICITFSHSADAFVQSDLQMRTTEAINCSTKTTKTDPKLKAKPL